MKLGVIVVNNRFLNADVYEKIKKFIEQEFKMFFDAITFVVCKNKIKNIDKELQKTHKYDIILIIDNMRLENYDYNIEFYKNWLDRRIKPLEDSLKYALALKFGPLTALSSQIAGIKDDCYVFAFPNRLDEIKEITFSVIKTFILNHLIFNDKYKSPLNMLKEYVEDE